MDDLKGRLLLTASHYQSILEPWIYRLVPTNFIAFTVVLVVYLSRLRAGKPTMAASMVKMLFLFNLFALVLVALVNGQSSLDVTGSVTTHAIATSLGVEGPKASATRASPDAQYTLPPSVEKGAKLLPNILDPKAVNPQDVCPGYKGSNVVTEERKITADLTIAGEACNIYGNDVADLKSTV